MSYIYKLWIRFAFFNCTFYNTFPIIFSIIIIEPAVRPQGASQNMIYDVTEKLHNRIKI